MWFSSYESKQTDRHTHHNTSHPSQGKVNRLMFGEMQKA